MLKLKFNGEAILREKAKPIRLFDDNLRRFAQQMMETMLVNHGIGLAANQVGIAKQMIIVWTGVKAKPPIVMCNPEIIDYKGEQVGLEGCLSFPDIFLKVKRPHTVICRYQDLRGKHQTLIANDLLARCISHEIDHLHGKLMTDLELGEP